MSTHANASTQRRVPDESRYTQSLDRGLALLACFTAERTIVRLHEFAEELRMSKSTAHRYASTLVQLGFLEQTTSRGYRLAPGPTDLGLCALNLTGLREPCRAYLEELREGTGYSAGLGVLNYGEVVYIDYLRSFRRGQPVHGPTIHAGVRVPAHCTSIGKALLAALPQKDRKRTLAEGKRERLTEHTITKRKPLSEQLQAAADQGYALSDQEFYPGARSLAVVVRNKTNDALAAVELSAYQSALPAQTLVDEFLPTVWAIAEKISHAVRNLAPDGSTPTDSNNSNPKSKRH